MSGNTTTPPAAALDSAIPLHPSFVSSSPPTATTTTTPASSSPQNNASATNIDFHKLQDCMLQLTMITDHLKSQHTTLVKLNADMGSMAMNVFGESNMVSQHSASSHQYSNSHIISGPPPPPPHRPNSIITAIRRKSVALFHHHGISQHNHNHHTHYHQQDADEFKLMDSAVEEAISLSMLSLNVEESRQTTSSSASKPSLFTKSFSMLSPAAILKQKSKQSIASSVGTASAVANVNNSIATKVQPQKELSVPSVMASAQLTETNTGNYDSSSKSVPSEPSTKESSSAPVLETNLATTVSDPPRTSSTQLPTNVAALTNTNPKNAHITIAFPATTTTLNPAQSHNKTEATTLSAAAGSRILTTSTVNMIKEVGSVNELGDDEEPPHQQHTRSVSEASSGTNRSSKLKTGGLRSSCNSKVSKTSTGFITASLSRFLMGVSAEATQSPKQNSATAPILKTAANGERRMSLSDFNHYTFIPDASAPKVSDTPSATTTGSSTKSPQPSTAISIPTDPLLVSVDKRRSAFIRYCARYIWSPVYTEFGMSAESEDGVVDTNAYKIKNPQRGVHPLSYFYALWQLFMAITYMFVIMALPVLAAFESIAGNTSIVTWVVMTIYTFDSIVSFNLLSIKDGEIATDLKITRRNYMYKMLLFDVITTIPFDAIFQSTWSQSETLLITHVPRAAFRLFSCIQNNPYFVLLGKTFLQTFQLGASFMSMFFLGGLLVVYIHLHACTYFLVGRWTNFSSSTWGLLDSVLKSPAGNQYSWAIFSAMGNTFPITGFKPDDPVEQWITTIMVLVGAILYAALVGTISSFSFGLDSSGRLYKQKMDEVNEYLLFKNISEDLKNKVKQYYEMKYRGKLFDENNILNELNDSLRQDIAMFNCRDLIAKVPFLRRDLKDGRDEMFSRRIASALQPVYYTQGDRIIEQGRTGNEMYFILKENLEISINTHVVGSLKDGSFFGEVALLAQVPRTASIRAVTSSTLYCLQRSDFEEILKDYEDMAIRIRKVYQERMEMVKNANAKDKKEKDDAAGSKIVLESHLK